MALHDGEFASFSITSTSSLDRAVYPGMPLEVHIFVMNSTAICGSGCIQGRLVEGGFSVPGERHDPGQASRLVLGDSQWHLSMKACSVLYCPSTIFAVFFFK